MFSYFSLFLLIPIFGCQANWQIDWSDEFNGNSLDYTKWDVTNEVGSCNGNYIQQLNCKTNSSRNLWLFNGTVSIAAVKGKYLDKDYTSAMITTKQSFKFGKFAIRAAQPSGKSLRTAITFIATKYSGDWPKDGQIDMLTNAQTNKLANGIHVIRNNNDYEGNEYPTPEGTKLNEFHTYVVEWNQTAIVWKFDEKQHFAVDFNDYFKNIENPFLHPFKIVITLGVAGQFFTGILTEEDARNWNCSLLILDYVRVYRWVGGAENPSNESEERTSSSNICGKIMPLIRRGKYTLEDDVLGNNTTDITTNTDNSRDITQKNNTSINRSPIETIISALILILLLI